MIAILKYNAGNIGSVKNALSRLGYQSVITNNPDTIKQAHKVIFPGVGQAKSAMNYLKERQLDQLIKTLTQPVLGICLGLQLMCKWSEEGNINCLGIFNTKTKRFPPHDKVPHVGWNNFSEHKSSKILKNTAATDNLYYVHTYYAELCKATIATCNYIVTFSAVMQQKNFYAMQFHPEKSSTVGEQLLKNFLTL
ncbi:MAG: imidazole glycerol phosphate synthase subunit HisH [Tenacibaculum sp.]